MNIFFFLLPGNATWWFVGKRWRARARFSRIWIRSARAWRNLSLPVWIQHVQDIFFFLLLFSNRRSVSHTKKIKIKTRCRRWWTCSPTCFSVSFFLKVTTVPLYALNRTNMYNVFFTSVSTMDGLSWKCLARALARKGTSRLAFENCSRTVST